jgi:hypothetical protein
MKKQEAESITDQIRSAVETVILSPGEFNLDIDALNLRIYLRGKAWSGVVDRPLAKFLIDLDKMLSDELRRAGIEIPISDHGLIALRVEDGSLEAILQYGKGILAEIKKLKPKDQIFIAVILAGAFGISAAPEVIEKLEEPHLAQIASNERVELVNAMVDVFDAGRSRQIQQPIRSLIGQMGDADILQLPDQPAALNKSDAKALMAKGTRTKPTLFHIDGRYIVEGLTTKTPGKWVIALKWGDVVFKAKVLLTPAEITELMEAFQLAHETGQEIAPDFQIAAEFTPLGEIKSATVTGLEEQRANSRTIGDVIKELQGAVAIVPVAP